jgi:aspartyl-tRNA(Asn)/glutamyl-tRNA(Gln) amidotransferase subunit A
LPDPYRAFLAAPDEEPAGDLPRLAVKDLIDTAGVVTTYGSAIFREHVPERTAPCLEAALDSYRFAGKTNLHEFAYGITSDNPHFGAVVNPLDAGRIPGGSSGGNGAALAAGFCEVAVGTDSAGSIRLPAACCGIVGFKPTWGVVSAGGVFPLAPSFDTVGPMARSVSSLIALHELLLASAEVDHPGVEPLELSGRRPRAALAWTEHADPLVRARIEEAAALLPDVERINFPLPEDLNPAFQAEAADVHRELFAEHTDFYGENVRRKLEAAFAVSDEAVEASRAERDAYREGALVALEGFDILLTPTMPMVAPPVGIGDLALRERMIRLTRPFNGTGWPALALPCGPAEHGLPASLQVAARPGEDALVLAVGEWIERGLPG